MYGIKPNHPDSLRTGCQLLTGTPLDHDSTNMLRPRSASSGSPRPIGGARTVSIERGWR
jgi:hypothetical protein